MIEPTSSTRVVGAAILQRGTCLVAQRSAAMSAPLKWEFPGGKLEPGEDPREALAREIREELALEIEVGDWLGRGESVENGRRIDLDVFLATIVSGDVRLTEHRSFGWFEAHEIDRLDWAAADVPVLEKLKERLRLNPPAPPRGSPRETTVWEPVEARRTLRGARPAHNRSS